MKELNDCIDTLCSKHGMNKSVLMEWKGKVIDRIDENIKTLSKKTSSKLHKSVLLQSKPFYSLNFIQNQFVVNPKDKANVDIAFISNDLVQLLS